jgi:hypothetical protein
MKRFRAPTNTEFGPEDDHPGVDADQEIAPERQDHQQHQQVALLLRAARDQQRQRVGDQQAHHRGQRRVAERLDEQLGVQEIREEARVVLEGQIEMRPALVDRRSAPARRNRRENGTTPPP